MDDLPHHHGASSPSPSAAPGGTSHGRVEVEIVNSTPEHGDLSETVGAPAVAAIRHLGLRGQVRVRVVGDAEMAAAHLEFCDVEGTTDVLTFDMSSERDADGRPVLDVDILACADEAARQGAARGHTPERELLLYIVHGLMHCLGHDDHDEASAAAMHAEEDRVLTAIGVGATYGVPERAGQGPGGAP
jgi:rRNA maturation RNase YbeY